MKKLKIIAINPGSTSTKVAVFEDGEKVFSGKAVHSETELETFPTIYDQFEYRREAVRRVIVEEAKLALEGTDCFVARCSGLLPLPGGVYQVTQKMIDQCYSGYTVHPAIHGGKLAKSFADEFGGLALVVNPPDVDEMEDVSRVTGFHEITRYSSVHMLNQKETAYTAAAQLGKKYEECRFVVAHLGGGVSIAAHRYGKVVDCSGMIMGEGPLTPTRAGALPLVPFMDLCFSGKYTRDEMYARLNAKGGFLDLLGVSEVPDVMKMIRNGDEYAKLVMDAFIYNVAKYIGSMAAALEFKLDAILLGGAIAHTEYVVSELRRLCGKLAPIKCYPGELELEALGAGALRVLRGEDKAQIYSGIPRFQGFGHLKRGKGLS